MDEEEKEILRSLGWTEEQIELSIPTPEHRAVNEMFRSRAQTALSAAGLTALQLLAANQQVSIVELARILNRGASALGLEMVIINEAISYGTIRDVAKDLLIRNIFDAFPKGWSSKGDVHPLVKLGSWHSAMLDYTDSFELAKYADRVAQDLTIDNPPDEGWTPLWPKDPLIDSLFDKCWPV